MTDNYIVVLFKNKQKKKIIKSFKTEKKAKEFYERYLKSSKPVFEMLYENAEEVEYELSLMTNQNTYQLLLFKSDVYGRNEKVFVDDDSGFSIIEVKPFKLEEKLYDWQDNKRISFEEFLKTYCNKKDFKNIFSLNNKVVVQIDNDFKLFSLKNSIDSHRFITILESYFMNNSRNDSMFVKDTSTVQRKWLYNILEENGFDRKKLYKQVTTYSKR
jgi:uncharacterized membrane protein